MQKSFQKAITYQSALGKSHENVCLGIMVMSRAVSY